MDEVMRSVQGALAKTKLTDSIAASVGGSAGTPKLANSFVENDDLGATVAKLIEFYVPSRFSTRVKWLPPQHRGRVIEFRLHADRSEIFFGRRERVEIQANADIVTTRRGIRVRCEIDS